ncbi:MAG: S1 RNA-binding domain-containing protein, partial [Flavobacteriales bacterium]|nr:S1 RNA-binding domain-containing protein [Flavobacteriales bacterium]
CELEEGVDGLVHISDLSWNKRIKNPGEFCQIGDKLDVVVLELDKENRRISLGHKQLEENPWDVFETVFNEGSRHQGTIVRKEGSTAIVALPYGVEGYALSRMLKKADGSTAKVDETLEFEVVEFNKNARRITVSHTRTFQADEEAPKSESGAKKPRKTGAGRSEEGSHSDAVKAINAQVEKTTLGDLSALAGLKESMDASEKKEKKDEDKSEE